MTKKALELVNAIQKYTNKKLGTSLLTEEEYLEVMDTLIDDLKTDRELFEEMIFEESH